jgi:metallo-beta-lactamase family protein
VSAKPTATLQFLGAAGEVTGSCHLLTVGGSRVLLDCGMVQGAPGDEARNREPFPFDPESIDAVVLSHAHIDHSGRLPLLVKAGYKGPIFTQYATHDLCDIMLRDAAYLHEKDAEWENRKRARKHLKPVKPLYTQRDAEAAVRRFEGLDYGEPCEVAPGVVVRLHEAGHILGSATVHVTAGSGGATRRLVFSGDLGRSGMPVLEDPSPIRQADRVVMESTYGDRLHRGWDATREELKDVLEEATADGKGNVLIPAFAVGRSQLILFLFAKYYREWGLDRWKIYLDSPMAIEASEVYGRHVDLLDKEARRLWHPNTESPPLPNLHLNRTPEESMALNDVRSGAIIIAGSGMCTGGRIRHHLKHNVWRPECRILITGFQARGTLGRALVDGARRIRLWGETMRVAAQVHTIGGLSAHADRDGLTGWYGHFENRPSLTLVHGEEDSLAALARHLSGTLGAKVAVARRGETVAI